MKLTLEKWINSKKESQKGIINKYKKGRWLNDTRRIRGVESFRD